MARTKAKAGLAQALLDAHIQHLIDELTGTGLRALIETEVDAALRAAASLKLGAVVSRAQVKASAQTFAAELEFGGGLPELVGDIGRALYAHPIHDRTTAGALIGDTLFAELLDKALELKSLREKLIREVVTSPLYADFASDLLYRGITGYLAQNAVTRNIPGAGSVLKLGRAALSRATPKLEASIEDSLKKYIAKTVQASTARSAEFLIEHADAALLREIGLDSWRRLKDLPLGRLREDFSSRDIEELFVDGYELWRALRKSAYYRTLIDAGIDAFFDKYEAAPLATLLEDMGIGRAQMLDEGLRYGPSALKALHKKKLLEPLLRRRLSGFYESAAAQALLGGA